MTPIPPNPRAHTGASPRAEGGALMLMRPNILNTLNCTPTLFTESGVSSAATCASRTAYGTPPTTNTHAGVGAVGMLCYTRAWLLAGWLAGCSVPDSQVQGAGSILHDAMWLCAYRGKKPTGKRKAMAKEIVLKFLKGFVHGSYLVIQGRCLLVCCLEVWTIWGEGGGGRHTCRQGHTSRCGSA